MGIPFTSRVSVPEHVLSRKLDDELVLLNMHTETYLGLDDVGARFWEVLSESESINDALEKLLEEYDVEEDRLRRDLAELVSAMTDQGLIELEGD